MVLLIYEKNKVQRPSMARELVRAYLWLSLCKESGSYILHYLIFIYIKVLYNGSNYSFALFANKKTEYHVFFDFIIYDSSNVTSC